MTTIDKIASPFNLVSPEVAHAQAVSPEAAIQSARNFESFFVSYVFQTAFESIPKSEFLNGGMGEEVFNSMFVDQVTSEMSVSGRGLGLADQIARQVKTRYANHGENENKNGALQHKETNFNEKI